MLRRIASAEAGVFALALIARLGVVANGGGFHGVFNYDASVYYSAGDALLYGRLPYADFTFLHPPGVILATAPFAALGNLFTDHRGFVLTCVGFTILGALSAVLVVRIARRLGLGTPAAVTGGLVYAAWPGSIGSEYLCRLEPLGNVLVLSGLALFWSAEQSGRRRSAVLSGVALAAAVMVKIWWLVPALVVAAAHLLPSRRRRAWPFLAGLVGAAVVIAGPFFVAAPRAMVRMIVLDQADRPNRLSLLQRLVNISGLQHLVGAIEGNAARVVAVLVVVVIIGLAGLALRLPSGWIVAAILVIQFAALLTSPSSYGYYDDYLAPELALAVAIALRHRAPAPVHVRRDRLVCVGAATAAVALVAAFVARGTALVTPYPSARLAAGVVGARCVMSNNPSALIMLNVLSRGLTNGCTNYIDLEGRRYDVDKPKHGFVTTSSHSRWQRDLCRYLLSGDALAPYPASQRSFSPKLRAILANTPVRARAGGYVVYDTRGLLHSCR